MDDRSTTSDNSQFEVIMQTYSATSQDINLAIENALQHLQALQDITKPKTMLDKSCIAIIEKVLICCDSTERIQTYFKQLQKAIEQYLDIPLLHKLCEYLTEWLYYNIDDIKKSLLLKFFLQIVKFAKETKNIQPWNIFTFKEMFLLKFMDHIMICTNRILQKLELQLFHEFLPEIDVKIAEIFFPKQEKLQIALVEFSKSVFSFGITPFMTCINCQNKKAFCLEAISITFGSKKFFKDRTYIEINCTQQTIAFKICIQDKKQIEQVVTIQNINNVFSKETSAGKIAEVKITLKTQIKLKEFKINSKCIKFQFQAHNLIDFAVHNDDEFLNLFFHDIKAFKECEKLFTRKLSTRPLECTDIQTTSDKIAEQPISETHEKNGKTHHVIMPANINVIEASSPSVAFHTDRELSGMSIASEEISYTNDIGLSQSNLKFPSTISSPLGYDDFENVITTCTSSPKIHSNRNYEIGNNRTKRQTSGFQRLQHEDLIESQEYSTCKELKETHVVADSTTSKMPLLSVHKTTSNDNIIKQTDNDLRKKLVRSYQEPKSKFKQLSDIKKSTKNGKQYKLKQTFQLKHDELGRRVMMSTDLNRKSLSNQFTDTQCSLELNIISNQTVKPPSTVDLFKSLFNELNVDDYIKKIQKNNLSQKLYTNKSRWVNQIENLKIDKDANIKHSSKPIKTVAVKRKLDANKSQEDQANKIGENLNVVSKPPKIMKGLTKVANAAKPVTVIHEVVPVTSVDAPSRSTDSNPPIQNTIEKTKITTVASRLTESKSTRKLPEPVVIHHLIETNSLEVVANAEKHDNALSFTANCLSASKDCNEDMNTAEKSASDDIIPMDVSTAQSVDGNTLEFDSFIQFLKNDKLVSSSKEVQILQAQPLPTNNDVKHSDDVFAKRTLDFKTKEKENSLEIISSLITNFQLNEEVKSMPTKLVDRQNQQSPANNKSEVTIESSSLSIITNADRTRKGYYIYKEIESNDIENTEAVPLKPTIKTSPVINPKSIVVKECIIIKPSATKIREENTSEKTSSDTKNNHLRAKNLEMIETQASNDITQNYEEEDEGQSYDVLANRTLDYKSKAKENTLEINSSLLTNFYQDEKVKSMPVKFTDTQDQQSPAIHLEDNNNESEVTSEFSNLSLITNAGRTRKGYHFYKEIETNNSENTKAIPLKPIPKTCPIIKPKSVVVSKCITLKPPATKIRGENTSEINSSVPKNYNLRVKNLEIIDTQASNDILQNHEEHSLVGDLISPENTNKELYSIVDLNATTIAIPNKNEIPTDENIDEETCINNEHEINNIDDDSNNTILLPKTVSHINNIIEQKNIQSELLTVESSSDVVKEDVIQDNSPVFNKSQRIKSYNLINIKNKDRQMDVINNHEKSIPTSVLAIKQPIEDTRKCRNDLVSSTTVELNDNADNISSVGQDHNHNDTIVDSIDMDLTDIEDNNNSLLSKPRSKNDSLNEKQMEVIPIQPANTNNKKIVLPQIPEVVENHDSNQQTSDVIEAPDAIILKHNYKLKPTLDTSVHGIITEATLNLSKLNINHNIVANIPSTSKPDLKQQQLDVIETHDATELNNNYELQSSPVTSVHNTIATTTVSRPRTSRDTPVRKNIIKPRKRLTKRLSFNEINKTRQRSENYATDQKRPLMAVISKLVSIRNEYLKSRENKRKQTSNMTFGNVTMNNIYSDQIGTERTSRIKFDAVYAEMDRMQKFIMQMKRNMKQQETNFFENVSAKVF